MKIRCLHSVAVVLASVLASGVASADDAADTATARALGVEGVTLANAGNCKDAVEKLERAEKLHHAPTTATRLAECEIELGMLVRGTERLQRVVREPLPANAHPAFGAALARAHKLLDGTLPRIPRLRIGVDAPPGTPLSMTIDDEPISEAVVDTDRPIDPGTHVIKVSANGYFPASVSVSLDVAQAKSVTLELRRDPNATEAAAAPAALTALTEETTGSKVPAFVSFGVAALGLGFGIYGAVAVEQKMNVLSQGCDANRVCPPELRQDLGNAKTWAAVSTAGFMTAGVGAAAGVVLLLVSGGSTSPSAKSGLRVRPNVSATSLGVDGVF